MSLDRFLTQVVPVRQKLYRLAYRLVGNAEDAQDITQDALMKVWDMQEKMAEVENMEAWCMRITRNLALDKIKYGKYRMAQGLDGIEIALPQKNPHALAEEKDVVEKVNHAIQALPEKYRTILQLRDIEGYTYQEIADIMDSSINEVKVNLHRARKSVREKPQNFKTMDYKRIILLVEKYWQTETTLEEEAELRAFFSKPLSNLPKELKEAAPLFQYFHEETQRNWPVEKARTSLWQQWKYAAILVVAAGGFLFWQLQERQQDMVTIKQHEVNNPQQALEETKKALQLLAKNLNKGTSKMEKLSYFNEAASMIEGKE